MPCPIGCGKVYSQYLYIIYYVILDYLTEIIITLDYFKNNINFGLFGFVPKLKKHILIKNLFMYLGFIIFGLIFFYIFIIRNNKKEKNLIDNMKNKRANSGLIYNGKIQIRTSNSVIEILIVSLFFSIFYEINIIVYSFGFYDFDLWTFNIIFTIFFIKIYYSLDQYSHQLYSLIFVFFINLIFIILSSFLPRKEKENINSYNHTAELFREQLFCIPIYLIFILNSYLVSFSRVKSKVLMEFNYISPYKIIILIGFFGLLITSILLTFTSIFKCEGKITKICDVIYEDGRNELDKYYDNFLIYFSNLKLKNETFEFWLEILLIIPLFSFLNFMKILVEMLTIFYLNPFYILFSNNLYYGTRNILSFIFNYKSNPLNIKKFILDSTCDFLCILAYLIYLEIIECRFCGLNKNLKKSLFERSKKDLNIIEDDSFHIMTDDSNNEEDNESNSHIEIPYI